jgi:hypothetical protein
VTAKLRNLLVETNSGEAGGNPRPERLARSTLTPDRVAEDVADLLLGAAAVAASAPLELDLDFVVELADQELSHGQE